MVVWPAREGPPPPTIRGCRPMQPAVRQPAFRPGSASASSRWAIVSVWIADSTTWSLSVTMIERVRLPLVASTSFPACLASSFKRFIGAEPGSTMAMTRATTTIFPNPTFSSFVATRARPLSLHVLDLLPELLQCALQRYHVLRDLGIIRLRPDGVGLALHLL